MVIDLAKCLAKLNVDVTFRTHPDTPVIQSSADLDTVEWFVESTDIENIMSADAKPAAVTWEAVSQAQEEINADEAAAETKKTTDAANGNQKLLDLGLTQDEVTAMTGYKPGS